MPSLQITNVIIPAGRSKHCVCIVLADHPVFSYLRCRQWRQNDSQAFMTLALLHTITLGCAVNGERAQWQAMYFLQLTFATSENFDIFKSVICYIKALLGQGEISKVELLWHVTHLNYESVVSWSFRLDVWNRSTIHVRESWTILLGEY